MEVDHIIPRYKGGRDIYLNLQLLHKHCHIAKTRIDLDQSLEFGGEMTPT
jgi:RNA-directed DNA polymerase